MTLKDLVRRVPNFAALSHPEKIKLFAWWLHTHGKRERFDVAAIRGCYNAVDLPTSANPAQDLARLEAKRPRELLKDANGYRLEGSVRQKHDSKHGEHETTVVVTQTLSSLPGKVSDQAEKLFLSEALTCYRNRAFRAAIVMTWNLAYDHLLGWILADAQRLANFNAAVVKRYPQDKKKAGLVIAGRLDFEDLKESETIEIAAKAALFSDSVKKILLEKLTKRNTAAHPSLVTVTIHQADDVITDLVNNVVLALV